ncbi:MAG: L-lactate permease [Cytophagaceae bacterium]|nr:L-lactate permease [Cytophagaceae bacterium]MDW8455774.1 L-lactate permease [Cytophagaceae bacterium]
MELIALLSIAILLAAILFFKNIFGGLILACTLCTLGYMLHNENSLFIPIANSFLIFFELVLLLSGALFFYNVLQQRDHFSFIDHLKERGMDHYSLLMMLSFFLISFFEGIAGFGIPAMLIAPKLMRCGYSSVSAVVLSLCGGFVAVLFGALGTPIKMGFDITQPCIAVYKILWLNMIGILSIPLLLYFLSKYTSPHVKMHFKWRSVLAAGFCFLVPFSVGVFLSPEWPSVLAGSLGLWLYIRFFTKSPLRFSVRFWWRAFRPYIVFLLFLILYRYFCSDMFLLEHNEFKKISAFQPGFLFWITGSFFSIDKAHKYDWYMAFSATFKKLAKPLLTLLLLIYFSQVVREEVKYLFSSIIMEKSMYFADMMSFLSGIAGAFLTGSATMSNILFTSLKEMTFWSMAMLHSGSVLGNIVSLQNIIMVNSVTEHATPLHRILRFHTPVLMIYSLLIFFSYVYMNLFYHLLNK